MALAKLITSPYFSGSKLSTILAASAALIGILVIKLFTTPAKELSRLTKEKAFVEAVPYAFSLLFMGFTLSAITRLWTQFRYNHQNKKDIKKEIDFFTYERSQTPEIFKNFEK